MFEGSEFMLSFSKESDPPRRQRRERANPNVKTELTEEVASLLIEFGHHVIVAQLLFCRAQLRCEPPIVRFANPTLGEPQQIEPVAHDSGVGAVTT